MSMIGGTQKQTFLPSHLNWPPLYQGFNRYLMHIFEKPIDFAKIGLNRIGNQNRTIFKFGDCTLISKDANFYLE